MSERDCNECGGEGVILIEGPGIAGYNSAGAPYPTQREVRCDYCRGTGVIEDDQEGEDD